MSARMTIYKNTVIMVCAECVADDGDLVIDHVWNRSHMTETTYNTFLAIMDKHNESEHPTTGQAMLTRTQTQHQILNHLLGCRIEHPLTDDNVERVTSDIMEARNKGQSITTWFICATCERVSQAEQYLQYLESLDTTNETR